MPHTAIPPLVTAYAIFVLVVASSEHTRRSHGSERDPQLVSANTLAIMIGGGYALFLAIVLVFHSLIADQAGAIASAATGGLVLMLIAAPAFAALSYVERRLRRRDGDDPGPPGSDPGRTPRD